MSTTLKNSEVMNSLEAIEDLMDQDDIPVKLSYAASKNKKVLEREKEDLDDFRREMLNRHAEWDDELGMFAIERDEDGEPTGEIKFKSPEDRQQYLEVLDELFSEEIDLNLHNVRTRRVESVQLPPGIVFALRWMFVEDFE